MFVLGTETPRLLFNKGFPVTEVRFKTSHLGFGCWRLELEKERKEDRCSRGSRGGLQVKEKMKQNENGEPWGALFMMTSYMKRPPQKLATHSEEALLLPREGACKSILRELDRRVEVRSWGWGCFFGNFPALVMKFVCNVCHL